MNSAPWAHVSRVDVAGSTPSTLEALRRRSEVEDFELVEWPSYAALAADLERQPDLPRTLLLYPAQLGEIPAGWIRGIRSRAADTRIVVLAGQEGVDRAHPPQLEGDATAPDAPLPPSPVASWFSSRDHLATLHRGAPPLGRWETHRLRLPSQRRWIPAVTRLLCRRFEELGWADEMVRSVLPLVLDEAVSNAMGHGNGWDPERQVQVRAVLGPAGFRIEVEDQGSGFVREEVRDPVREENLSREGGRGLFLMERLVDEVRYEKGGRRVVLVGGEPPVTYGPEELVGELVSAEN